MKPKVALHGWRRGRPDPRDLMFAPPRAWARKAPPVFSNRPLCSPVEDQGTVGSCTGNAAVGALEALLNKEIAEAKAAGRKPPVFVDLSRLFIYWWARKLEGSPVTEDSGAQIRDCFKALSKYGTPPESMWPYGETEAFWAARPSGAAMLAAKKRKILSYYSLDARGAPSASALEATLSQGFCVEFGFSVPENFVELVGKTGVMPKITRGTRFDGGHAVLLVGYDSQRRLFEVRNSWGEGWGDKGYFWMPYENVLDSGISDDFWFCSRQELG